MLDRNDIISLLQENETFAGVRPETLEKLVEGSSERECAEGELLIEQGVRSADLFVAIEGEFVVTVRGKRRGARTGSGAARARPCLR